MAKLRETLEQETGGMAEPAPKPDKRRRPRLMIALTEDGQPDVSNLDDGVRARLRDALAEPAAEPPAPIDPAVVVFALRAISNIEAAVLAGRFGLDQVRAAECVAPPPMLAEQIGAAGARVLAKHSGAWTRWQDEIVLGALLVTWQAGAIQALRAAAAEVARAAEQEKRESPPAKRAGEPEARDNSAEVPEFAAAFQRRED